jgi:hypothetical protein
MALQLKYTFFSQKPFILKFSSIKDLQLLFETFFGIGNPIYEVAFSSVGIVFLSVWFLGDRSPFL